MKVTALYMVANRDREHRVSEIEFVCLMGGMMALISLSLDSLLPAFAAVQSAFAVPQFGQMQYLLTAYMAGFGIMQLVYGVVSDAIGRRPTLTIGLAIFCFGSVLAMLAKSYEMLLVGRAVQGMGAAAARVLADTIVRDRYSGHKMASILSLIMMIFIIVQIIAPIAGQITLAVGNWQAILSTMLVFGAAQLIWFRLRLPETLDPAARREFSRRHIVSAIRLCLSRRVFVGYAMAMALMQATLLAYLGSAPGLFGPAVYALGSYFGAAFGAIAAAMGIAALVNARMVGKFGVRRVAHAALIVFAVVSTTLLSLSLGAGGKPALWVFLALLALAMFAFSLSAPNFSALAMEEMGEVAGTAASLIGTNANVLGAALGALVGLSTGTSTVPLSAGFLALSALALIAVYIAEDGRLFALDATLMPEQSFALSTVDQAVPSREM